MDGRDRHDGGTALAPTRREFIAAAGTSLLALSAAQLADLGGIFALPRASAADPGGTREIAVGILAPSHCAAPYVFAEVRGLYEKHGLKATVVRYEGMPEIARDLVAGRIQFGQLMLPLLLAIHCRAGAFKDSGVPLVTTLPTGIRGGAITVRKDSGISKPEDLAGRTIGSHSPLSAHYLLLQAFMRRNLAGQAPLAIKVLPLQEMIPALSRGEIDGFIMPEPVNAVAVVRNSGRTMFLTSRLWKDHPCCMFTATASFAQQNPGTVRAASLALAEACLFADRPENRAAFIEAIAGTAGYAGVPRQVLTLAFEAGRADYFPFPYRSSARVAGDLMKELGLLPAGVSAGQVVAAIDPSHAREALRAAGMKADEPDYRLERLLGEDLSYSG